MASPTSKSSNLSSSQTVIAKMREHEQRLISQLTLKRNSVTLQLRKAEEESSGSNLDASRKRLENLAHELDRHLAAVAEAAARRGDEGPTPSSAAAAAATIVRDRRTKRPAPAPPGLLLHRMVKTASTSNPDISVTNRHAEYYSSKEMQMTKSNYKLHKSLSMSGSRNFLTTVMEILRRSSGNQRYRLNNEASPLSQRYSKSHDYLDLAPLDQEQRMVNDAARRAQMRRGTVIAGIGNTPGSIGSPSAEPRRQHMLPPISPRIRHHSGERSLFSSHPRRPDRLQLPSPGRSRYAPREPSPLARQPTNPRAELFILPVTPPAGDYYVAGVSKAALNEIRAFEELIYRFFIKQSTVNSDERYS